MIWYNMYSNIKKTVDRRIDARSALEYMGAINLDQSIFIADWKQMNSSRLIDGKKKLVVKIIPLFNDSPQVQNTQQAILRKLVSSSPYFFKPDSYDFRDGKMYLVSKLQRLSLQTMIWIHRREKKAMSKELVRQFTLRMFQGLARLKQSDIFPQNIKPSNLFLEQREGERNWVWSQAGLHTNRRNQFYCKINLQMQNSKANFKMDPLELDFYSLAIILLEMITLQPAQKIDKVIRARKDWGEINNFREASEYYGKALIGIIQQFLEPPKDAALTKSIQELKQYVEEEDQEPDYSAYYLTDERVEEFFKNEVIAKIEKQAKQYVKDRSCSAKQVLDQIGRLDPQYSFGVTGMQQFQQFLKIFQIKLLPHELLLTSIFYYSKSMIHYFNILQTLFSAKELIEAIIVKAVDNYDSFKDFFEAQTDGRDYWKAQELKLLLDSLQVHFQEKQINQTVKAWNGTEKTSIKYEELYKTFKPILGMTMSLSVFKKTKTQHSQNQGDSPLKQILEQLIKKESDLVSFFRKHDLKQNWIIGNKIQKIIRNYVKMDENKLKKAFAQMWEKGSIPGDLSKQINYIYLLRNMQIYDNIQLLRLVITQKINESDRQTFFDKYKKDEKGWSYLSFVDFNVDENLQFEQRELKALFGEIDTDHSGFVDSKELFYRLTGLKQFDYQSIVDQIKKVVDRQGINLFNLFRDVDPKARLVLGQVSEIATILQKVGVQISEEHLGQLYQKFSRSGKFQYISFLHQFYSADRLFLDATRFVIKVHYRGDFDKLFHLGLRQGRKKWNRQSLTLINQELILGFRQIQLGKIWQSLDPHQEGSLTKQEIAEAFNYEFEEAEEFKYKPLQSRGEFPSKKKHQQEETPKKVAHSKAPPKQNQNTKQLNLIEQFRSLGEKRLLSLPLHFLRQSQGNGKMQQQNCLQVLTETGIKAQKSDIIKVLARFKESESSKRIILINYVKFYFYVIDSLYRQDFPKYLPKYKGNTCLMLMKELKRMKKKSLQNLFQSCRDKDKMKFSDFEEVFKDLVETEVYSADLQEAWQFWGEPKYFSQQDMDRMLQTNEYQFKKSQKVQKKPVRNSKAGQVNRMAQFVQEEGDIETPYLKNVISFADRDNAFPRQNSRKNSIRDSDGDSRGDRDNHRKWQNKEQQKTEQTGRFGGDSKRKSPFNNPKSREEKIQIQEVNEQSIIQKNNEKNNKSTKTKSQLVAMLKSRLQESGDEYINEIFAKVNVIELKKFVHCLTIHYNFSQSDANALADSLGSFGKLKLEALRNVLSSDSPSQSKEKWQGEKSKRKRQNANADREQMESKKLSPSKDRGDQQRKRLIDPRRQKVNVPMVRQHIKMLITTFCKRFQPSQLQGYFFSEKDLIGRNEFITKCQSISTTFTGSVSDKIFDYLKPDINDKIGILSFKLGMSLDQPIQEGQEDYLPEELQKELKLVFEKADTDHSGFIEPNQIQGLLSSLGLNQNVKQIQNYFARLDQNFDNRISFSQFRHFIEDQIIPQLSTFDEEEEELEQMLLNNDIFRTGSISAPTFQAVIQRYGVKLTLLQVQIIVRSLNPEGTQMSIRKLMNAVREPTLHSGKVKAILYKIRLRKKVQLREVQKIFESISSCFVLAYTSTVLYRQIINISTPYRLNLHQSGLFFCDLPLRDARKAGQGEEGLIGGQLANSDILVEMLLKEVNGVPIPQKPEIKSNIVKRYMNVSIFDMSAEAIKYAVWQVEVEWDPEVEDCWRFSNNLRSLIIKIGGYEPRKFQKMVVLFELVIVVVDGGRTLQINCGCANMPLRELLIPEGKVAKKVKLIAGLPNRSKEIDKNSISKRSGWKNFFGGDVESDLQLQLVHQNKFSELRNMISALPPQAIFNRKALHYLWTYREFLAENAFDGGVVNSFLRSDLRVLTFALTLDVPDLFGRVWPWWKDKAEPKIKTLKEAKNVFRVLMQELYLMINAKQFELLKKCPAKPQFHNKSLLAVRSKMLGEVFENMENWLSSKETNYKRRKNYNYNYAPLQLHEVNMPREHVAFMEGLARLHSK